MGQYFSCPYCQNLQQMPAPKLAGQILGCPFCKSRYRFTGIGAISLPQQTAPDPPLPPPLSSPVQSPRRSENKASIVFWLLAAFIIWCIALPIHPGGSHSSGKPDLEVLENHWESDEYRSYLAGTVINNSSHVYGYVQVEINLTDESGNLVGSSMDNINNLGAGQKWNFKALVTERGPLNAQIMNVSGF